MVNVGKCRQIYNRPMDPMGFTTGQTFPGSTGEKLLMVFKIFLQETPAEPVAVGSEVLVLPYPPAVKDGMRLTNAFGSGRTGGND